MTETDYFSTQRYLLIRTALYAFKEELLHNTKLNSVVCIKIHFAFRHSAISTINAFIHSLKYSHIMIKKYL